jgi:ribonuclease HII
MLKALLSLDFKPELVLVDGQDTVPGAEGYMQKPVIGGDDLCLSIACASIAAKVFRDDLMNHMDILLPGFEFGKHKGYGTALHYDLIRQNGISEIHRRSFKLI